MADPNAYQRRAFGQLLSEWERIVNVLGAWRWSADARTDPELAAKLTRVMTRMHDCCRYPVLYAAAGDSHLVKAEKRCRSRLCPRCGVSRAKRVAARLRTMFRQLDSPRLVTLTLKSSDDPLRVQMTHLVESLARLRKTASWRAHVRGGVYVIEVTWNAKRGQWHPHLHVVTEGKYYPQAELKAAWIQASGTSSIVDVRAIHSREAVIADVTRYVTKSQDAKHVPDTMLPEWAEGIHGLRMMQAFGCLHGITDDEDDEEERPAVEQIGSLAALATSAAGGDEEAETLLVNALNPVYHQAPNLKTPAGQVRARELQLLLAALRRWFRGWEAGPDAGSSADPPSPTARGRPSADPQLWPGGRDLAQMA
jgi:hypothetical protein